MVTSRADEISQIIRKRIEQYNTEVKIVNTGTVLQVGDDIAHIYDLDEVVAEEGSSIKVTRRIAQIPVSEGYLGRVINALAKLIDGRGEISTSKSQLIESPALGIISRRSVYDPLQTGLIAIDSIGQKASFVAQVVTTLHERGTVEYTIIVAETANSSAILQYLAPYTGATLAKYFMYREHHTLIIYDDPSKHAHAYRQMSLLLQRPRGREAYPEDVFYLHASFGKRR
ncbi:hypothetical protein KIW84_072821 [Lathyrus oleraceus]|uniref:ATPase F1/V1/A1 complex alpha/beta subunit nucleotide-binding domain-containing protein n=1 Tax=Pisum sativum TaxID=3888 RepID=A0A9D4VNC7_PEA|nr:hypothetical protein KIW84_072821 [Pisum sativum]